ncbi:DNA photolyase family protein, partial [Candidatus Dependentiae bacterium]|nr:DNA photolyase family protein [Candidatus Dependentiae bacterium]
MKKFNKSLFIFRRDLRIEDNTGLIAALKESSVVVPCFIFDPRQVGKENSFASSNSIQFMIESLQDLKKQLNANHAKLYLFYGIAENVVNKLIKQEKIDAIFLNRDYSPFSIKRDKKIEKICKDHNIYFQSYNDLLLNQPEDIKSGSGTPYSIFTPFYKAAVKKKINLPEKNNFKNYYSEKILGHNEKISSKILKKENEYIAQHGGTQHCLKILKNIKQFKDYEKTRNFPSIDTTKLSAHNKFGTCSIRTIYHSIGKKLGYHHSLLRQLYWRDFFIHVLFNFPDVLGHPYHKKFKNLKWNNNKKNFEKWCNGQTGFPLVDAGMRQLNKIGFMHNRVRMVVASFLVKDLHIDWRWGEKYFAQKLVDYDVALNNGNWQWNASTGCDAQPYFRIFNPWLQQKRFDPKAEYIKKWIPELKDISEKDILNWQ